jgi:hypothetical protein
MLSRATLQPGDASFAHKHVPGPQYLEVWVWSLTKIMSKASYGHQPHEFQAGALGIYVFHCGYRLRRRKAMFTFTKETEDMTGELS